MIRKIIKKIHAFRIFFFVLIIFATLSSVGVKPLDIGAFFGAKIGQAVGIGVSVGVEENPFNKLALQLKEREAALDAREADLDQRENQLSNSGFSREEKLLYSMGAGILVLFVLILINFILDHRRRKELELSGKDKTAAIPR